MFDLIVVGLGAMGAATVYHAARRGMSVLGIDRFDPPHEMGSTHAESRITRLAVGEGTQYLPFVARSHEIWRELEPAAGEQLFLQSGGYIISPRVMENEGERWGDFVSATAAVAADAGIGYEITSASEARSRTPQLLVGDHERVGFEPTAGIVLTERAVAVQLAEAERLGATIRINEPVTAVEPIADSVAVATAAGTYEAAHVVLSTGAWFKDLAAAEQQPLVEVTRQVVFWFEVEDATLFAPDRFPWVIWAGQTIDDYFSAFPAPPGGTSGIKVLTEQFHTTTDPRSVERTVSTDEIEDFYERYVRTRLAGVTSRCVQAKVCLYTSTTDEHFLIDTDPRSDRITVFSACSGHGFKHSTALGEAVAEVAATGTSTLDLAVFKARF